MGLTALRSDMSPDEIDVLALARMDAAEKLPPGSARDLVLKEAFQFRAHADMKRLLVPRQRRSG